MVVFPSGAADSSDSKATPPAGREPEFEKRVRHRVAGRCDRLLECQAVKRTDPQKYTGMRVSVVLDGQRDRDSV